MDKKTEEFFNSILSGSSAESEQEPRKESSFLGRLFGRKSKVLAAKTGVAKPVVEDAAKKAVEKAAPQEEPKLAEMKMKVEEPKKPQAEVVENIAPAKIVPPPARLTFSEPLAKEPEKVPEKAPEKIPEKTPEPAQIPEQKKSPEPEKIPVAIATSALSVEKKAETPSAPSAATHLIEEKKTDEALIAPLPSAPLPAIPAVILPVISSLEASVKENSPTSSPPASSVGMPDTPPSAKL